MATSKDKINDVTESIEDTSALAGDVSLHEDELLDELLPSSGTAENNTVVFDVPGVCVSRNAYGIRDGRRMYNYSLRYPVSRTVNGQTLTTEQTISLVPSKGGSELFDLLDLIYMGQRYVPAKIVKTISSRIVKGREYPNVSYNVRVSATDDDGVEFVCNLSTRERVDRDKFSNYITRLKAKGLIT